MVQVRPEPSHTERRSSAGTAAQRHPGFGVLRQFDARLFLGTGQDFVFHELDVLVGNGVVFHAALRSAVVDHDRNHHGQALIVDHVVENGGQVVAHAIGIGGNDNRRVRTGDVLRGNINANVPLKWPVDSGVGLALGGVHHKLDDLALGDTRALRKFGSGGIGGAGGVVAVNGSGGPCGKVAELRDFCNIFGGRGRLRAATSPRAIRGGLPDAGCGWRGWWRDAGNRWHRLGERELGDEEECEAEFHVDFLFASAILQEWGSVFVALGSRESVEALGGG